MLTHQAVQVEGVERGELQLDTVVASEDPAEEGALGGGLPGQHQGEPQVSRRPGHPLQQRQCGRVDPVDVVDHEELRTARGELVQSGEESFGSIRRHGLGQVDADQPARDAVRLVHRTEAAGDDACGHR